MLTLMTRPDGWLYIRHRRQVLGHYQRVGAYAYDATTGNLFMITAPLGETLTYTYDRLFCHNRGKFSLESKSSLISTSPIYVNRRTSLKTLL